MQFPSPRWETDKRSARVHGYPCTRIQALCPPPCHPPAGHRPWRCWSRRCARCGAGPATPAQECEQGRTCILGERRRAERCAHWAAAATTGHAAPHTLTDAAMVVHDRPAPALRRYRTSPAPSLTSPSTPAHLEAVADLLVVAQAQRQVEQQRRHKGGGAQAGMARAALRSRTHHGCGKGQGRGGGASGWAVCGVGGGRPEPAACARVLLVIRKQPLAVPAVATQAGA